MSWFDNMGDHASSVVDWFAGQRYQPTASGVPVQDAEEKRAWGSSGFAKATGLAPWAKWLGMGQGNGQPDTADSLVDEIITTGGYKAKEAGTPTKGFAGSARDVVTGNTGGVGNKVSGEKKTTGFGRSDKGGFKTPEHQSWSARGKSFGNREDDMNAEATGKDIKVTDPSVWHPDLSKIGNAGDPRSSGYHEKSGVLTIDEAKADIDSRKDGTGYSGGGSFRSSKYGSYSGYTGLAATDEKGNHKPEGKFTVGHSGKGSMGIAGWEGQWGAEEKGGWRATAVSANKQHTASAEAGWVASGGASGGYGLDTAKGAYAQGGVGGKVGAYAQGDADTRTGAVKIGGEDYDMGAGVHGEVFAGAKAGASGMIGLGPDFVGAKGEIGAFFGAEAAGDVHANLGPVGGKLGGSVMAGAGIGADGDLSYKDGKFHVGGKMFAAMGYGGSLAGDVTIDVGAIGRSAYDLADDAADLASDAGSAIASGASAAGSAIASGAETAYDTAGDAVSSVLSW